MLYLKTIRRVLALFVFSGISLYFTNLYRPEILHSLLTIQLIPALLAGSLGILAIFFLFTLLFGRIYCSLICPWGILQDLLLYSKKRFFKNGKRAKKRSAYRPPQNIFRYGILALTVLSFFLGTNLILLILDPYSQYGRLLATIGSPLIQLLTNALAAFLHLFNNYSLSQNPLTIVQGTVGILTLLSFSSLIILTLRYERLWCNTLCPVGTLLGLIARVSVFRLRVNPSKCNQCKACTQNCKSQCIDPKTLQIDASRCVNCYNCINTCKSDAIAYSILIFNQKNNGA